MSYTPVPIGVSITGHHASATSVLSVDRPSIRTSYQAELYGGYERELDTVARLITDTAFPYDLQAVGIGIAGEVADDGTLQTSPNNHDWQGQNPARDLSEKLGRFVVVQNDAVTAAAGENYPRDFHLILWTEGFGGCYVTNQPRSRTFVPEEPGHWELVPGGRPCGCGKLGCVEAYVGGAGIRRHFGKESSELTLEEWESVLHYMARGLAMLLRQRPAPMLIFAGALALEDGHRLGRVRTLLAKELAQEQWPKSFQPPEGGIFISISGAGNDAIAMGGIGLLKHHKSQLAVR